MVFSCQSCQERPTSCRQEVFHFPWAVSVAKCTQTQTTTRKRRLMKNEETKRQNDETRTKRRRNEGCLWTSDERRAESDDRVRKISPKLSCIKFFQIRDVPTQIPAHPGHSLSKTTEKGHLHKVFVRDIPTSGSRMSQEYPAQNFMFRLFFRTWDERRATTGERRAASDERRTANKEWGTRNEDRNMRNEDQRMRNEERPTTIDERGTGTTNGLTNDKGRTTSDRRWTTIDER